LVYNRTDEIDLFFVFLSNSGSGENIILNCIRDIRKLKDIINRRANKKNQFLRELCVIEEQYN